MLVPLFSLPLLSLYPHPLHTLLYSYCYNDMGFFYVLTDIDVISKFAQLEYKVGEPEQGQTMFENVLSNYPKRTDIWSIYLDMVIKTGDMKNVR